MHSTENSIFCVTPNDERWQPMCSQTSCDDVLLGEEECRSPFGTYELVIPVDNKMSCDDPGIRNKNCKDLDVSNYVKFKICVCAYKPRGVLLTILGGGLEIAS